MSFSRRFSELSILMKGRESAGTKSIAAPTRNMVPLKSGLVTGYRVLKIRAPISEAESSKTAKMPWSLPEKVD